MNQSELDNIIQDHNLWQEGDGGCRANLRRANLRRANLRRADLRDANLRDADLRDANLRDANLRGADLCDANLRDANLRGADLCGANLCDANLRDADLCGANLCDVRLWDCVGNRREIMSILVFTLYPVTYTFKYLQIGCERHNISDWWSFDDERISEMEGEKPLNFWRENKDFIKMIIERFPAVETKHDEETEVKSEELAHSH